MQREKPSGLELPIIATPAINMSTIVMQMTGSGGERVGVGAGAGKGAMPCAFGGDRLFLTFLLGLGTWSAQGLGGFIEG